MACAAERGLLIYRVYRKERGTAVDGGERRDV